MSVETWPLIMQDKSEVVDYDQKGIPLYIRKSTIDAVKIIPHWHDELEFIMMLSGKTLYHVNDKEILVKTGDCFFVNSRQMHFNETIHNDEEYICILVHPQFLVSNKILFEKFVRPVTLEYIHWSKDDVETEFVANILKKVLNSKSDNLPAYEIICCGLLQELWQKIFHQHMSKNVDEPEISDLKILRDMLSFIYQNYSDKIFLDDIARSGQICRSKCCKVFKKYMKQSPIDFVNAYRLAVSCHMLKNSDKPITQISLDVGFSQPSYFGKLFQRVYHSSPTDYREKNLFRGACV